MVSVLEAVKRLEQVLGVAAEIDWLPAQIGDVSRTWADISEARKAIGYNPQTEFEQGIEHFARWLRDQ
jgi:UDP-glucuronate 4-epimerase